MKNKPASYDITFCISKCKNKKCERNYSNLYKPNYIRYLSVAELKDTEYCPEVKDGR